MIDNAVIQTILSRRSVRRYSEQAVEKEKLETVLECALYAPTGGNHQYTRFLVIQDKDIIDAINGIVQREFGQREIVEGVYQNKTILKARQSNYHFLYHAPVLVIVVSPRAHGNSMADCANAMENMQIAAASLGLGCCYVNQLHWMTDHTELREYLSRFGIREEEDIYASLAVGYLNGPSPRPSPRKEGRIIWA